MYITSMMWEVACADGQLHEFEESMIWRVSRLLGVFDRSDFAARVLRGGANPP